MSVYSITEMRTNLYNEYKKKDLVYLGTDFVEFPRIITTISGGRDTIPTFKSETTVNYANRLSDISAGLNILFLQHLEDLANAIDTENSIAPFAGFPLAGERIIRVGDTFKIYWDYKLISDVDVFFIKGGTKIPVTLIEPQDPGIKAFVISIIHFSDEYLPCKVILQSKKIDTIFDESFVFKVLKGN